MNLLMSNVIKTLYIGGNDVAENLVLLKSKFTLYKKHISYSEGYKRTN